MTPGRPQKARSPHPLAKAISKTFWKMVAEMDPKDREKLATNARKLKRPDVAEAILRAGRARIAPKPPLSEKAKG